MQLNPNVHFSACDMPEANDLTVGIMALVAQQEGEALSRQTKDALAAAKARGVKLGIPNGAATLRQAGKGGVSLHEAVSGNALRDLESSPAGREALQLLLLDRVEEGDASLFDGIAVRMVELSGR